MSLFNFEGANIHYSDQGKGEAVLFIHGFCEDSSVWEDLIPGLSDKRIITLDLPGFGQSETIPKLTIEKYGQVIYALLAELDLQKIVLIGHSMGGYVALSFAEKFPNLLLGLGLFNSHPFPDSEETKSNRKKAIEFIEKFGAELYVKQLIPALFTPKFKRSNNFLIEKITFNACNYDPKGITTALSAMANRKEQKSTLVKFDKPVLHLMGKEETVIPHEINLEQSHLAKVASIHILKNVGHMAMYEAKEKSIEILNDFFEFCTFYESTKITT